MSLFQNMAGLPSGWAPLNSEGRIVYKVTAAGQGKYVYASLSGNVASPLNGAGMEMYYLAASGQPVASLSTIKGDVYQSFVGVHANNPSNEVDLYSRGGSYYWKRSMNTGEEALITFYDYTTGEPFMRITRQNTLDYRLAIVQNGGWVTK